MEQNKGYLSFEKMLAWPILVIIAILMVIFGLCTISCLVATVSSALRTAAKHYWENLVYYSMLGVTSGLFTWFAYKGMQAVYRIATSSPQRSEVAADGIGKPIDTSTTKKPGILLRIFAWLIFLLIIYFSLKRVYEYYYPICIVSASFIILFASLFLVRLLKGRKPIRQFEYLLVTLFFSFAVLYVIGSGHAVIRMENEGAMKWSLGVLRSALTIYYGDTKGYYPTSLQELVPKYIDKIPLPHQKKYHTKSSSVVTMEGNELRFTDEGGWLYNPKDGKVHINCTHTDTRRQTISSW